ncbi:MAG: DNA repair protein RecN (Recombination protein N) [Cellvibrionaceae bacterium]|jgi:DNA repair protein RecN (Recombination protein N)
MLTHLTINNFMLIGHLDFQLKKGMTAITGETGTGKSILLGALSLALGERADGDKVRQGNERADITATFLLDDLPEARQWLTEHDLGHMENSHADECLLRRVVARDGRSRAFINSQPVPLQQVRALGELLIDIHSQHAHQSLLSKLSHQKLLDQYAQHLPLSLEVRQAYQEWQSLRQQYITLRDNADEMNARYQLLSYQVDEFNKLDLLKGEIDALEAEQQTLANAEGIISKSQQVVELCDSGTGDNEINIRHLLHQAVSVLQSMRPQTKALADIQDLMNNAMIYVDEAQSSLQQQIDSIDINPQRLQQVEERLSAIYDIARKHHIEPEAITVKHQSLADELSHLSGGDEALSILEKQTLKAEKQFLSYAKKLSKQRQKAAQTLTDAINKQLSNLAMGSANFLVSLNSIADKPNANGIDDIEFLISTNPGQAHKSLHKVVSGGELSRISLAIQVATAQTSTAATLVFDEVDVGIGGSTADVVGKLLGNLGQLSQVLCVTHLAQVASKANHHWQVSKACDKTSAETHIVELSDITKIEEIARMISGDVLSDESIAHARLMVEKAVG